MNESAVGTSPRSTSGALPRSVVVVAIAIVALIATTIVVTVALPSRTAQYPAGSPEAAYQAFYAAWDRNDIDAAYALLSWRLKEDVTLSDFRRMDSEYSWQRDQRQRVTIVATEGTGDIATIRLKIERFSPGGLGGDRYSYDRSVRMVHENGEWRVDEPIVGAESAPYGY